MQIFKTVCEPRWYNDITQIHGSYVNTMVLYILWIWTKYNNMCLSSNITENIFSSPKSLYSTV